MFGRFSILGMKGLISFYNTSFLLDHTLIQSLKKYTKMSHRMNFNKFYLLVIFSIILEPLEYTWILGEPKIFIILAVLIVVLYKQNLQTYCWSNYFKTHLLKRLYCILSLSWRRSLSYRNQSIDLLRKSVDWFLYDNGLHHERVKATLSWSSSSWSSWSATQIFKTNAPRHTYKFY